MARKVFFMCAGMLMLALSYHFGATTAGASGAAASVGFASPTEVAVLSGLLQNGETIPLPTYADGTVASEAECNWTVSEAVGGAQSSQAWCYAADATYGIYLPIEFLNAHRGRVVNIPPVGASNAPATSANYLIIATRVASGPTSAQHESWGQVKARYRSTPPATPGMTAKPGANDR
jgi:hypothetical protein